jgi:hypothetical protein
VDGPFCIFRDSFGFVCIAIVVEEIGHDFDSFSTEESSFLVKARP